MAHEQHPGTEVTELQCAACVQLQSARQACCSCGCVLPSRHPQAQHSRLAGLALSRWMQMQRPQLPCFARCMQSCAWPPPATKNIHLSSRLMADSDLLGLMHINNNRQLPDFSKPAVQQLSQQCVAAANTYHGNAGGCGWSTGGPVRAA